MGGWDDKVLVIVEAEVVAKTKRAILCESDVLEELDEKERWIPFSQIDFSSDINMHSRLGDTGTFIISRWIAEQKGLV